MVTDRETPLSAWRARRCAIWSPAGPLWPTAGQRTGEQSRSRRSRDRESACLPPSGMLNPSRGSAAHALAAYPERPELVSGDAGLVAAGPRARRGRVILRAVVPAALIAVAFGL